MGVLGPYLGVFRGKNLTEERVKVSIWDGVLLGWVGMGRDRISRGYLQGCPVSKDERRRFTLWRPSKDRNPLRIAGARLGNLALFPRPWRLKTPIRRRVRV